MSDLSAEATYLMNNRAFLDALESAQKQCLNAAMACEPKDDEGRRRYLDAARTVTKVAGHLNALIVAEKTGEETNVADFYVERARSRWAFLTR